MISRLRLLGLALVVSGAAPGCGGNDEPYKPAPAYSGRKANLPPVPPLPTNPIKAGDAYTIFGAIHHLRSRYHDKDVTAKPITIQGYIVESNIPTAPTCAVHPMGKKDPDDCKDIPIPSFWIADTKGETKGQKIRVLGWARNFAVIYEAMQKYRNLKDPPTEKQVVKDEVWQVDVPFPIPSVGAKVKITGKYGYSFQKSSTGLVSDPQYGVLTFEKMEVLEPAPEPAAFAKK
jgi:hypothetical protein